MSRNGERKVDVLDIPGARENLRRRRAGAKRAHAAPVPEHVKVSPEHFWQRDLPRLTEMVTNHEPLGELFVQSSDNMRANPDSPDAKLRYQMVQEGLFAYLHTTDPTNLKYHENQSHVSIIGGWAAQAVGIRLAGHATEEVASCRREVQLACQAQHDADEGFYQEHSASSRLLADN